MKASALAPAHADAASQPPSPDGTPEGPAAPNITSPPTANSTKGLLENDSGYSSNTPSQNVPAAEAEALIDEAQPDPCPCRPPRLFPLAHRKDVYLIDQAPTLDIRTHFLNIELRLYNGLKDERRGPDTPYSKGVAVRLVMLGTIDTRPPDAKPSIVVFCPEARWGLVKKFFERPEVRCLYQPPDDDPNLPKFDFYLGPPLRLKTGLALATTCDLDILLRDNNNRSQDVPVLRPTLCGTPIYVRCPDRNSFVFATLGGIVQVTMWPMEVVCYGLTAVTRCYTSCSIAARIPPYRQWSEDVHYRISLAEYTR
ncbi:hypothetical protein N658DRAFT_488716 [Parathielavia hyrcaniae]|uniref:Uncharacterized protein n=1 Tax=Parathielavia hyrcaniae TaxID=113614 RepID=A0AAN6SY27_9PEZI|nr:hypothetical protein N658DRAFT_488716 [Parathielavia hyrcaniae]